MILNPSIQDNGFNIGVNIAYPYPVRTRPNVRQKGPKISTRSETNTGSQREGRAEIVGIDIDPAVARCLKFLEPCPKDIANFKLDFYRLSENLGFLARDEI